MMNNVQMKRVLAQHEATKDHFMGVFSSDEIPWTKIKLALQQKCFFIFNLDSSEKDGSHWVCIMLGPCCLPLYFDSYGLEPKNPEFEKFMDYCYCFNDKPLQHATSTNCGQWCMYFIYHMSLNHRFQDMLNLFDFPLLENDYLLSQLVRKIFQIDVWPLDKEYFLSRLCADLELRKQTDKISTVAVDPHSTTATVSEEEEQKGGKNKLGASEYKRTVYSQICS